jgi:hypothetical protein
MKLIKCLLFFPSLLLLTACTTADGSPAPEASRILLMAHYMPWYQTPAQSGYWGWHWKMDHFDPDQQDPEGFPQIASHYMPLTGPYDSKDADLLEYQVLLMKLSGIDGVIVDWYGSGSFADYPVINQATARLFEAVKKAGLLFAICYEDQTVRRMAEANLLSDVPGSVNHVFTQGEADLKYLQDHWFTDEAYLKFEVEGAQRPVLLNFGPQYFISAGDWETLFMNLEIQPALVTLDQHPATAAIGTFPWPPMGSSTGGVLTQPTLEGYLNNFYRKMANYPYKVAGAFPGFHDIYQQAGVANSYGFLDAQDGMTFELTLDLAIAQDPDVIQLITWNDYGEGTIIEPTEQFGYRYLEMLQAAQPRLGNTGFGYTPDDLRLPLKLFQMRKTLTGPETRKKLDEASNLLLAGETAQAAQILAAIP